MKLSKIGSSDSDWYQSLPKQTKFLPGTEACDCLECQWSLKLCIENSHITWSSKPSVPLKINELSASELQMHNTVLPILPIPWQPPTATSWIFFKMQLENGCLQIIPRNAWILCQLAAEAVGNEAESQSQALIWTKLALKLISTLPEVTRELRINLAAICLICDHIQDSIAAIKGFGENCATDLLWYYRTILAAQNPAEKIPLTIFPIQACHPQNGIPVLLRLRSCAPGVVPYKKCEALLRETREQQGGPLDRWYELQFSLTSMICMPDMIGCDTKFSEETHGPYVDDFIQHAKVFENVIHVDWFPRAVYRHWLEPIRNTRLSLENVRWWRNWMHKEPHAQLDIKTTEDSRG